MLVSFTELLRTDHDMVLILEVLRIFTDKNNTKTR